MKVRWLLSLVIVPAFVREAWKKHRERTMWGTRMAAESWEQLHGH